MVSTKILSENAVNGLYNKHRDLSAKSLSYGKILTGFLCFIFVLVLLFFWDTTLTLTAIIIVINIFYLITFVIKSGVFILGIFLRKNVKEDTDYKKLEDKSLPIYTILIPLYHERKTIKKLLEAIKLFDYPQEKLDVKLVLEEDDFETIEYVTSLENTYNFHKIIVPNSQPKTKPKACNYALQFAKGKYVTVFDAEDVPKKFQLKQIINKFRNSDENLICIQAQLNYYNRKENLLTKMFSIEYSGWFDFMIKGLDYLGLPIPLGGTSNHFKTEKLRELGVWDAYNVTEDADLGIRIARFGYECSTITAETAEEAPFTLKSWIKQRSRWIKGYIQTYFVHMKSPGKLLREIGMKKFIGFQIFIGGTFFVFLTLIPMLILSILIWTSFLDIEMNKVFKYMSFANFLASFLFMIISSFYVTCFRNWSGMFFAVLLFPFYWILHCIASFRALSQIISKKSYFWEKTEHGKSSVIKKIRTHQKEV
jgi:cellulose synthase/poly-beta-1,6-N-acetylglucosamine synthase-like glycosyltransferase